MTNLKSLLFLLIIFSFFAGCTITHKYGPYKGKVVDKETKEAIEGVAVLVVFYTEGLGPLGSKKRYADAIETTTNRNGNFVIPPYRITSLNLFHVWHKYGYFTIFKPGYGCYPRHKEVAPMFVPNGTLPPKDFITIELPNITHKTRKERLNNAACLPSEQVPDKKYSELRNLSETEYKLLGAER